MFCLCLAQCYRMVLWCFPNIRFFLFLACLWKAWKMCCSSVDSLLLMYVLLRGVSNEIYYQRGIRLIFMGICRNHIHICHKENSYIPQKYIEILLSIYISGGLCEYFGGVRCDVAPVSTKWLGEYYDYCGN